jgi:hypothetical protein
MSILLHGPMDDEIKTPSGNTRSFDACQYSSTYAVRADLSSSSAHDSQEQQEQVDEIQIQIERAQ